MLTRPSCGMEGDNPGLFVDNLWVTDRRWESERASLLAGPLASRSAATTTYVVVTPRPTRVVVTPR
ncbi:MAG: hypothetical protein ACO3U0_11010, partial [Ilumatobacteraceae bacterium]